MQLSVLPQTYAVHQFTSRAMPALPSHGFRAILVADDEITLVCETCHAIDADKTEGDWRAIKILAVMDFGMVGVIAKLSAVLAAAEVSIFVLSTYNTDYVLVKQAALEKALLALTKSGYSVISG